MAARFHTPHALRRHTRACRPGPPALVLVPAGLAAVAPMPRPAARPTRLVLLTCRSCDLATDPMPTPDAEQAAGTPTATLHTVHTLHRAPLAPGSRAGGPDFGGAA